MSDGNVACPPFGKLGVMNMWCQHSKDLFSSKMSTFYAVGESTFYAVGELRGRLAFLTITSIQRP